MPSKRSSSGRIKIKSAISGRRINSTVSRRSRRLALFLIGLWFGGILLVAIAAPASFRSVEQTMASQPQVVKEAATKLGPVNTRDLLRFQAGESMRLLFTVWGWTQFFFGVTLLLLLLFLSNAGRLSLLVTLAMTALSALANFFLIPRIAEITHSELKQGASTERFQMLHRGFTLFELTVVVLGLILVFDLFRQRESRTGSRELR